MGRTPSSGVKAGLTTVIAIVVALYAMLRPSLDEWFGGNLSDDGVGVVIDEIPRVDGDVRRSVESAPAGKVDGREDGLDDATQPPAVSPGSGDIPSAIGPSSRASVAAAAPGSRSARGPPAASRLQTDRNASSKSDLSYGILREINSDRFLSPEGLLYVPGSAEGHRLEHLRRHTKDQPSRPGKHGVFEGGMDGMLRVIDEAYGRAKKNQKTTKQVDRSRVIYTVDLGRRVGFVGGREGNRRGKPMARRVKIVLEDNRVITAYPL